MHDAWIQPYWPAPANVSALITTRPGGVSRGAYGAGSGADRGESDGGMNVGLGSGDDPAAVLQNRERLAACLPAPPRWLRQVHGAQVVDAESVSEPVAADAATAIEANVVAAVIVADCMPVLLADRAGRCVAAAHAGWRGLAAGVLQATAKAMRARIGDPSAQLIAYIGPAIGPQHFEVGSEVLEAMSARLPDASAAFTNKGSGKYLADLPALARQALAAVGVDRVFGGNDCTFADPRRFYSHRRDRVTGRHAAVIWRNHQVI